MLNSLQGSPQADLATALERFEFDSMANLRAHQRQASSPDALACYWDELFNAVCARLEQLAAQSAEPPLQAGMCECVAALQQLHATFNDERTRYRQQADEHLALRQPRILR